MSWMDDALKQIEKFTPESGYNVVAVDRNEEPGKALYLVGHFDDRGQAEAAASAHTSDTGDQAYVYEPKA